jgi:hypothetical protein
VSAPQCFGNAGTPEGLRARWKNDARCRPRNASATQGLQKAFGPDGLRHTPPPGTPPTFRRERTVRGRGPRSRPPALRRQGMDAGPRNTQRRFGARGMLAEPDRPASAGQPGGRSRREESHSDAQRSPFFGRTMPDGKADPTELAPRSPSLLRELPPAQSPSGGRCCGGCSPRRRSSER